MTTGTDDTMIDENPIEKAQPDSPEPEASLGGLFSLLPRLAGAPLAPFNTLSAVGLPEGAAWANWFAFLNALSWAIVLGAPLFLYAKNLGAGDALLGLLAALPPLLAVLHIPGAYLIPPLGYRRMMILGWGSRTIMIFVMAASMVLLHNPALRLAALFACIFLFSALRGLAGGAWMPWMTELVPTDVRGKFFLRDQLYGQSGNLIATLAAAVFLVNYMHAAQFCWPFLFAGVGGAISVLCLLRLPDIQTPAHHHSMRRTAITNMLGQRTFRLLAGFNVAYMLVLGGLGVFTVSFLRGIEHFSQSGIVLVNGMSVFGGSVSLFWCGRVLDRIGSRPIIRLSLAAFVLVFFGWWAMASHLLAASPFMIGALYLITGMAGINFAAANNRLQTLWIPSAGRNHYFAVLLVLINLAAGASPLVWGLMLELIGSHQWHISGASVNRYSIFFACGVIFLLPLWIAARRLADQPADQCSVTPRN